MTFASIRPANSNSMLRRAQMVVLSSLLGLAPVNAQANDLPDWFQTEYDTMTASPVYKFIFEFDDSTYQGRVKVDMSQPKGDRFVALSTLNEKRPKGFDNNIEAIEASFGLESFWCLSVMDEIPSRIVQLRDTDAHIVFGAVSDRGKPSGFSIEFLVSRESGGLVGIRKWAPKPLKPSAFFKLRAFDMSVACKPAPDGRSRIEEVKLHMAGSAFGRPFEKDIYQRFLEIERIEVGR